MKISKFLAFFCLLVTPLLYSKPLKLTAYLPSYRLESSQSAINSEALDLTNFSPTYESSKVQSFQNIQQKEMSLPASYEQSILEMNYGKSVDQIVYFSIKPSKDGGLDLSDIKLRDLWRLNNINYLYGTDIIITISGSSQLFSPIVETKETREIFIDSLFEFCQTNGFKGIDYDWEFPKNPTDKENFYLLISESHDKLTLHKMTVSAAVSRFQLLSQKIYDKLDYINLMAYDFLGRHSTYESAVEAVEFMKARFNLKSTKINLGIPFYGRIYSGLDPQYWSKTMTYSKILKSFPIKRMDDQIGGYYFNGIDTVIKKTKYAIEKDLLGLMIWELGQDSMDQDSLLKAIKETNN